MLTKIVLFGAILGASIWLFFIGQEIKNFEKVQVAETVERAKKPVIIHIRTQTVDKGGSLMVRLEDIDANGHNMRITGEEGGSYLQMTWPKCDTSIKDTMHFNVPGIIPGCSTIKVSVPIRICPDTMTVPIRMVPMVMVHSRLSNNRDTLFVSHVSKAGYWIREIFKVDTSNTILRGTVTNF
jgi:hypothetical protein